MSYQPHPSTIGYRAIQYLKTQPQDKWVASGPLAKALEVDSNTLLSCMVTVVKHGLLLREKRNGFWCFALGNVTAQKNDESLVTTVVSSESRPQAEPLNIDKIHRLAERNNPFSGEVPKEDQEQSQVPDPDPGKLSDEIDDDTKWGGPDLPLAPDMVPAKHAAPAAAARRSKRAHPNPAAPAVEPAQDDPFKFSWCSEGDLTVSKGGASVAMEPAEYRKLAGFIDVVVGFQL